MRAEELVAVAYKQYGHLVLRRCQYILRHRAQSEDALQEAFVRVMKHSQSFAEADNRLRWLYRVAERICYDMLRKKKPLAIGELVEFHPDHGGNPSAAASDREVLMKFLDRFDDRTKTLILLYHLDGYTQERIAEETGWSRQTVNKKLNLIHDRARALRRKLGVA